MGERRRVVVSDFLIEHAKAMFPPDGSASGSPRYEVFEDGPLAAAQRLFEHWFDEAPEAVAGIKHWITIELPFFPPMVFYAALVDDHVELLDVTVHEPEDYWDLVDDDPYD